MLILCNADAQFVGEKRPVTMTFKNMGTGVTIASVSTTDITEGVRTTGASASGVRVSFFVECTTPGAKNIKVRTVQSDGGERIVKLTVHAVEF